MRPTSPPRKFSGSHSNLRRGGSRSKSKRVGKDCRPSVLIQPTYRPACLLASSDLSVNLSLVSPHLASQWRRPRTRRRWGRRAQSPVTLRLRTSSSSRCVPGRSVSSRLVSSWRHLNPLSHSLPNDTLPDHPPHPRSSCSGMVPQARHRWPSGSRTTSSRSPTSRPSAWTFS